MKGHSLMNTLHRRAIAAAVSASALMILCSGGSLRAQDPGGTGAAARTKVAKRATDPTRRVPYYFGQLGLSDEQRETIYEIQARHQPKIEALEKQIEETRAQSLKECEAVLSDAQRKMLAERRAAAAEARAKRGPAARPQG
jgi:hypothetical protein